MAGILIKNVPDAIHRKLKARAASHRRSLNSEALVILEEACADRAGPPTLEAIDQRRVRGARPLDQELIDRARSIGRR